MASAGPYERHLHPAPDWWPCLLLITHHSVVIELLNFAWWILILAYVVKQLNITRALLQSWFALCARHAYPLVRCAHRCSSWHLNSIKWFALGKGAKYGNRHVCLKSHNFLMSQKHFQTFEIFCTLPLAMARSSYDDSAMHFELLFVCIMIMGHVRIKIKDK